MQFHSSYDCFVAITISIFASIFSGNHVAVLTVFPWLLPAGNLVISAYVGCPDIRRVVTPDLKAGHGRLLHVGLGGPGGRLGGSALAQCYAQLGETVPDLDRPEILVAAFEVTQNLINGEELVVATLADKLL